MAESHDEGLRSAPTELDHPGDKEHLRTLVSAAFEGIVIVDGTCIAEANTQFREMFGYGPDELRSKRVVDLVAPDERERVAKRLADPNDTGTIEISALRRDGSTFPAEVRVRYLEHAGRTVRVGALRDVTRAKQIQESLRESEARFRTLASATFEAIAISDEGWIIECNEQWNEIFGYEQGEVVGKHLLDFVAPEDHQRVTQSIAQAAPRAAEYLARRRDGSTFYVEVRGRNILRGRRTLRVSVLRDISDRKRIEETLRDSDRRKDEFLAVLAHELRNPLMPIASSLYVLQDARPDSEEATRALAIIRRQVAHLGRIIGDIVDVTGMARSKISLRTEKLNFAELVARAIEDHRVEFATAKIHLQVRLAADPVWLVGDPTRLTQIVANLLQNAAKFTPPGGQVSISVELTGDEALLRVKDSGGGIPPEMLNRIFEPFTQAQQPLDRPRGGLGLGLALAAGLVELHQGAITVTSDGAGCGAEFTVRLPLTAPPEQAVPQDVKPSRGERRRVLVIEDNRDTAESLRDAIERMGHDVRVALDGVEGLSVAKAFRPEVVLCDIGLPGMNGYQVAEAFRADESLREAHLYALTGYALPDDRKRSADAGFEAHLVKPISLRDVANVISTASDPAARPSRR